MQALPNKDIEAYRKEDALNKRYGRYKLASENPVANKKRLKDQAEKKRLYRLRKKLSSNATTNAANSNAQTEQQPTSTPKIPPTPTLPQPIPSPAIIFVCSIINTFNSNFNPSIFVQT